jgi:hypothetical protein
MELSHMLYSENKILSVFLFLRADAHTLYFGARNLDDDNEAGRVKIQVTEDDVIIYPGYNPSQFNVLNIALIKLPIEIILSRKFLLLNNISYMFMMKQIP